MLQAFCGEIHNLSDKVSYRLIAEGTFFNDGNVRVTAVHTDHMTASTDISHGFLIEGEGKRVYITGDLHPSLENFPEKLLAEHTDALVTECAHFPAEDLLGKLKKVSADKIMVVHVYPSSRYDDLRAHNCGPNQLPILYPNDNDIYIV